MEFDIRKYDCVGSTNTVLMEMADAKCGTVVIADEQTAGRGRMGRSFISEKGGLYMSVMLLPETAEEQLFISIRAAVAVHKALSKFVKCTIKWPNDILADGKKLCGILLQAQGRRVVLGIGVNITTSPDYAVSIADVYDGDVSAMDVAKSILENLFYDTDEEEITNYYRKNCDMLKKQISVIGINETYTATAQDIKKSGELVVLRDSEEVLINSGEVSVRG